MDKLVKLLNEYEREMQGLPKDFEDYTMWNIEGNEIVQPSCDPDSREYFKYYIISKDYQFIKRLVENDNINREEIKYSNLYIPLKKDFNKDDRLIMLLSISENPIEFLISMLK